MKCSDPILCYTPEIGARQFRHFSLASDTFKYHLHQKRFNCGKCIFCRKKKSYCLASRCVLHASLYKENCFLTLTYDEKKENYHNELDYSDIQKFKKRLRSHVWRKYQRKIEIFNVHEYGKNGKKHWHLIIFNYSPLDKILHTKKNNIPLYTSETLRKLWPFGFNTVGDVSLGSAMYQAQYMEKDIKNNNITNGKKSKSNHSGIGKPYFLKHYKQILTLGFIPMGNKKLPIPRYFLRLAHKHWCHFNDPGCFFDQYFLGKLKTKKRYTPFKPGQENKEISDLYEFHKKRKDEQIELLENDWKELLNELRITKEKPDFKKSEENYLYDQRNKQLKEIF